MTARLPVIRTAAARAALMVLGGVLLVGASGCGHTPEVRAADAPVLVPLTWTVSDDLCARLSVDDLARSAGWTVRSAEQPATDYSGDEVGESATCQLQGEPGTRRGESAPLDGGELIVSVDAGRTPRGIGLMRRQLAARADYDSASGVPFPYDRADRPLLSGWWENGSLRVYTLSGKDRFRATRVLAIGRVIDDNVTTFVLVIAWVRGPRRESVGRLENLVIDSLEAVEGALDRR